MDYQIFTEIGFGSDTFINTETEYSDGSEVRKSGFVKMKVKAIYIRIWIGKSVFILASNEGFKYTKKKKSKFKFLFGVEGVRKES
tara:strand:+ start:55981 stop:56235 length:255 start_codon:yes stop_codon:yes gene_type:complete